MKVKRSRAIRPLLLSLMYVLLLGACKPTQAKIDATITQIAANIFATETALAPTATQTFTPSPTSTVTPTAAATRAPLPTDTPTATKDPSILFSDDFSDAQSGWDTYSGEDITIEYTDGSYRMYLNQSNYYIRSTIYRVYTNVEIEADVRKKSGPVDGYFGLICRFKDPENFYVFAITSNGYYSIIKLINNEWAMLGNAEWSLNEKVVKTGVQSNHLKATCKGNNLIFEVNGSILMDVIDTDLTVGDIGFYVGTYQAPGVEVLFDNFLVRKP